MHLWSDYEGKTIDCYSLGQLIRPEGRSAFFFTRTGTGAPDVIRLTESLNDEAEMIERWRQVSELGQEHLLKIKRFGQTKFESTPLAFALMESSDGSLAEILQERPLTPAETREVAVSLVAALRSLHENGLVHEHVEPANVLAVGEVVKLRSDCVRECRLDSEFLTEEQCEDLKRKDIVGMATILLEALTLEKPVEGSVRSGVRLPSPFDRIIKQGLNGTMNLREMEGILMPPGSTPQARPRTLDVAAAPAALVARAETGPADAPLKQMELPVLGGAAATSATDGTAPYVVTKVSNSDWAPRMTPSATHPVASAKLREPVASGPALHMRRNRLAVEAQQRSPRFWVICAVGLVVVVVLGWLLLHGKPDTAPVAQNRTVIPVPAAAAVAPVVPPGNGYTSIADAPQLKTAKGPVATAQDQPGWHVVAYTYNHEDQARAKVTAIRERHSSLSPEVFAPSGHAPYLVGLGGAMAERDAITLRSTARKDGLPRDVFVRHFSAR